MKNTRTRTFRLRPVAFAISLAFAPPSFAAVCTVTNTNDSGAGSLRACIASANSGDTNNIPIAGTISLTTVDMGTSYTPTGLAALSDTTTYYPGDTLLVINKNLTIVGPAIGTLALDG